MYPLMETEASKVCVPHAKNRSERIQRDGHAVRRGRNEERVQYGVQSAVHRCAAWDANRHSAASCSPEGAW